MGNEKYDVIIGLEIHIQSKTKSKMFCSCSTDYFHKEPNTLTCPVCLGMPGALPLPNKKAIELCILLGLATNCEIDKTIRFDRKHYFYPDLPKGYQISQYDQPICSNGYLDLNDGGVKTRVEIERIHQEEDVAKSLHGTDNSTGESYTLIDYNKSGMPLIEIVTKPVIGSAQEAKRFASAIRQIARYLNVSNADMEKGQMRCEPNISVQEKGKWEYKDGKILSKGDYRLNPKVEVKNIGSITAVEKSIEFEVARMISELENGNNLIQQTRGWNADKGITEFQRAKESAQDYRYFPEPDIPIITLTDKYLEELRTMLPELPSKKVERYTTVLGLSIYDADVISQDRDTAEYFEYLQTKLSEHMTIQESAKEAANWLTGAIFSTASEQNLHPKDVIKDIDALASLIVNAKEKNISISKAKDIFANHITNSESILEQLNTALSSKVTDDSELEKIVQNVLDSNPKAVADFKGGKDSAIMFLVGMVMRETKGNAFPDRVRSILEKLLS